ncbi:Protoglobin [Chitinophaga jiangningensis]|uniref:Protoglobin n=1 Tax=Chitinophaga jiangningensis TaxID=1419482 RepID=A0A1M7E2Y6_9BACT|nr:protoglobin domain-containing protein [Chitinophaga jiangningensis]SHL85968.1 Protoglobin [Chitinophaga jiangningensis]
MLNTNPQAEIPEHAPDQRFKDLVLLRRMLMYTRKDDEYLQLVAPVISASATRILHTWYAYIIADPYLSNYFKPATAAEFAGSRFGEWLQQLCNRGGVPQWESIENAIPEDAGQLRPLQPELLRYLTAFAYPVIQAGNEVLQDSSIAAELLPHVKQAWFKAVTLSVALWAYTDKN